MIDPQGVGEEPTVGRPPEETPTVARAPEPHAPQRLTPGKVLGDRYRIVSLLGRGGMGEVFRADDLRLGQITHYRIRAAGDVQRPPAEGATRCG